METINTTPSSELATWNVPRSSVQLRTFVTNREDAIDVEEFDF